MAKGSRHHGVPATSVTAAQTPGNRSHRFSNTDISTGDELMAPMVRTYPTPDAARQAIKELRAAGVPAGHIRLLTSQPLRGIGRVARGGFAGPLGDDAHVGAFAGGPHPLGHARGSFATGSAASAPVPQRKGSFADVERIVIVTYQEDSERSRATGYRSIRLLLRRSGLDESAIDRTVSVLHSGHSVVLVEAVDLPSSEAWSRFQQAAKAA
jgi:hypothetical protein